MSEKTNNSRCYEIILNYNCNARCLFCSQGSFDKSLNADFSSISRNIYSAYKKGYGRMGFTGGEPLLRPDIIKIISVARKVGYDFIRIQTNGIMLRDKKFAAKLVEAGLTFCKFSFISDKPGIHDRLIGFKGAWESSLKGIENLKELKIRLGANILVNKLNYKRLPEIVYFFLEKGISNFVIIYPRYTGNMKKNADFLKVSLPEAEKYFKASIDLMEKAGLANEILFLNVPPCFLRGRESLSIGLDRFNTIVTAPDGIKTDLDANSDKDKIRIKACEKCGFKKKCGGVDKNYLEIFGKKGFKPVKTYRRGIKRIKVFLSDNEKCLIEILKIKSPVSTKDILKISRKIPLCRDCSDGNAVINAGESLLKKKRIERYFKKGVYYWQIKRYQARVYD